MTAVEALGLACLFAPLALLGAGVLAVGVWLVRDRDTFDDLGEGKS